MPYKPLLPVRHILHKFLFTAPPHSTNSIWQYRAYLRSIINFSEKKAETPLPAGEHDLRLIYPSAKNILLLSDDERRLNRCTPSRACATQALRSIPAPKGGSQKLNRGQNAGRCKSISSVIKRPPLEPGRNGGRARPQGARLPENIPAFAKQNAARIPHKKHIFSP